MVFSDLKITTDSEKDIPIYRQIGMQLKQYIVENQLTEGTKLPDLMSLAKTSGVSIRTMERSLQILINDKVCVRRPKKGTFVNGINGQRINSHFRKVCGILHSGDCSDFTDNLVIGPIYQGMQKQAQESKVDLLTLTPESLDFYYKSGDIKLTGVLLLYWKDIEDVRCMLEKYPDLPFVFINYDPGNLEETENNVHAVLNDDFAGGYEAGDALVQRGHNQYAIFTVPLNDANYFQRENGFREALTGNDIEWNDECIYSCNKIPDPTENDLPEIGKRLMHKLLKEKPETTAVFCVNDLIASGASEVLKSQGLENKIEIIGYDNLLPHLARDQRFSNIAVDFKLIGKTAIKFMSKKNGIFPKIARIAPKLLPRWNN